MENIVLPIVAVQLMGSLTHNAIYVWLKQNIVAYNRFVWYRTVEEFRKVIFYLS